MREGLSSARLKGTLVIWWGLGKVSTVTGLKVIAHWGCFVYCCIRNYPKAYWLRKQEPTCWFKMLESGMSSLGSSSSLPGSPSASGSPAGWVQLGCGAGDTLRVVSGLLPLQAASTRGLSSKGTGLLT